MIAHRRPRRRPSWGTIAAGLVLLAVVAFVSVAGYWYASGGRWLIVQTPSMGTAAPVGTLLWVEPIGSAGVHVGDVVSFHPPDVSATFTHRVHAIAPDGTISTKGDGNVAPDPWTLQRSDITGRVALRWWAVGWLVRAGPVLVIGGLLLTLLVRRFTVVRWKLPAATIGTAVLITLPIWIFRPLVRAQLVVFEHVGDHGAAQATYVSTGLLPAQVTTSDGAGIVLHNGQFGTVVTRAVDVHGRFSATVGPHLSWWMWVVLIVVCFVPALWSAAVGLAPERAAVRGPREVAAG